MGDFFILPVRIAVRNRHGAVRERRPRKAKIRESGNRKTNHGINGIHGKSGVNPNQGQGRFPFFLMLSVFRGLFTSRPGLHRVWSVCSGSVVSILPMDFACSKVLQGCYGALHRVRIAELEFLERGADLH